MRTLKSVVMLAAFVCFTAAAEERTIMDDFDSGPASLDIAAVASSNAFGESLDLYTGSTTFSITPIDIPGNNQLDVSLTFRLSAFDDGQVIFEQGREARPYLSGIFSRDGWVDGNGSVNRCSNPSSPPAVESTSGKAGYFESSDYWHGNFLHLPGGDVQMLGAIGPDDVRPASGGPYKWATKSKWVFSCVPLSDPTKGEGFVGISPNGDRYYFTSYSSGARSVADIRKEEPMGGGTMVLARREYRIYASRIEDRFGNTVAGTSSSDGRAITSQSLTDGRTAYTDGINTWYYQQWSEGGVGEARSGGMKVTYPDYSTWELTWSHNFQRISWGSGCSDPISRYSGEGLVVVKNRSGATGRFTFKPVRQGLSYVQYSCERSVSGGELYLLYPAISDQIALTTKTISGPGLNAQTWSYTYGPVNHCYTGLYARNKCVATSPTTRQVVVEGPGTFRRYTFGNKWGENDGALLKLEEGVSAADVQRITENTWHSFHTHGFMGGMAGYSPWSFKRRSVSSSVIKLDGSTFSREVAAFDDFGRPLAETESSNMGSLGYSRTSSFTYHDQLDKWVLDLPQSSSINGVEVSRTDYSPTYALPLRTYSFGKLQQTLGYTTTSGDQDGTLRTVKDGRNNVTTFTNWHRGIPQSIAHADGTSQSAVVNNDGTIASTTDENSFTTSYQYDGMGRLTKTTYPAGDSTTWTPLTQSFTQVNASEYGIPAGHWRHSVVQGNYRKSVFFDALWRPILVHEYDHADAGGTRRSTKFAYDHAGRTTFASYAGGSTTAPNVGIRTTYDALGRVTRMEQDSELGELVTTHEYLSGFQQRVTNPRLKATLFRYQAYGRPSTDLPERIVQPEGAYTYIVRNPFGNPTRMTRRNADGSIAVARHYVYDQHQQLCKRLEPETGATVMAYDVAGNLAWSAGGQNLPSTTACDTASVATAARTTRSYDARNRLIALSFYDGNGNQLWDYTPDGLPEQIVTYNDEGSTAAVNAYIYNKRRLLTGESLAQGNQYSWGVGYGYNGLGHLNRHTYPKGLTVDYAPNALGQPTQAGAYATGVNYYPNGAIAEFTYGNGILHTLEQNERGLPERSRDAYGGTPVYDDSYDYDPNGNVLAISDGRSGARGNRDMTYDAQDRLTGTTSPMFSPASYTYDVLDNLTSVKVAGRNHTYHYDHAQRLTNVRDAVSGVAVIGLGYDAQGNLANKNGVEYAFDYGNRLREVEARESYRYDGYGRRVQATTPTGAAIYSLYGNDGVLRYQEDYRKHEATNYVYLGGSLVAEVANATKITAVPVISAPGTSDNGSYTVSWTASSGADRYVLDESISGAGWIQIAQGSSRTWSVTGKTNASYRYRVRACAMVCSGYSNIATVTVALIPQGTPTLSAPAYDADGNFEVDWTAVPLAAVYELREQVDGGAWNEIAEIPELTFDITGRSPGIYGYQARACNPAGCADWNAPGTVTVYVQVRPNQVPTLTVPEWGRSGSYAISWSSSDGATSYVLEESFDGGAWTEAYQGVSRNKAFSGRAAGTYSYRVAACNPAGCTQPSLQGSVKNVYAPATAPVITAPAQNTDGSFTVTWTAVAGTAKYRLEESFNNGSWVLIHNGTSRSYARADKAAGTWRYRVTACSVFVDCAPWSAIATTVEIDPPSGIPTLTAPPLATNGNNYTVSWTAVTGATGYKLQESVNGAAWTHEQSNASRSRIYSDKPAGSYRYRVRAYNDAGSGTYSAIKTTEMVYKPTAAPTLTLPISSGNGSYTVSWTSVSTATRYELRERLNGGAWAVIYDNTGQSHPFSGKGNGAYEYLVRGCNAGGCGPYGSVKKVIVLRPSSVSSPSASTSGSYTVSWSSVSTATSYRLEERVNSGSWSQVYSGTARTRAMAKSSNGTYSYRVRACNTICSPYSAPDSTVVSLPPPPPASLTGRAYDYSEDDPKQPEREDVLSWSQSATATRYELKAKIKSGSEITKYNGPSTNYTWRHSNVDVFVDYWVRACNASGCSSWVGPERLQ